MKSKTVTSMMGHLYFDDAIIIGPPGTYIQLKIVSNSLDPLKTSLAFPSQKPQPEIYIDAYLRYCTRGEY
jgi:hypothetical protein